MRMAAYRAAEMAVRTTIRVERHIENRPATRVR
jgi:hypothetical protein